MSERNSTNNECNAHAALCRKNELELEVKVQLTAKSAKCGYLSLGVHDVNHMGRLWFTHK